MAFAAGERWLWLLLLLLYKSWSPLALLRVALTLSDLGPISVRDSHVYGDILSFTVS